MKRKADPPRDAQGALPAAGRRRERDASSGPSPSPPVAGRGATDGTRNESLKRAKGRWVFWMDADDTLPWPSGEAILRAAVGAGPEIAGFVVPVRFVTDDPVYGTRVDHVKLFRNRKGVRFEGRIHEQILPSLRASGGEIVRLDVEVLHSGYDTSEEGQRRKRERDYRLLDLDLADAPNHRSSCSTSA